MSDKHVCQKTKVRPGYVVKNMTTQAHPPPHKNNKKLIKVPKTQAQKKGKTKRMVQ
jgi:hypothetical protein